MRPRHSTRCRSARAFSVIELVIVVMIIGCIASIAIPRLVNASERSSNVALLADKAAMQRAIDIYIAEHLERCPATGADGVVSTNEANFAARLTGKTKLTGEIDVAALWGPYLRQIPTNPMNDKATCRVDGAAAGANTHGWRYDSAKRSILPDHSTGGGGGAIHVGGGALKLGTGKLGVEAE
ncbi:MAG: hypothetical protein IT435_18120 [Phycisphaerales bacterium]|nr:hypothetical protein [Phycisphaerales bacterium]